MLWILGILAVIFGVLGGYLGEGASISALWQPFEFMIIIGAAGGAMLTSSTRLVLKNMPHALRSLIRGTPYTADSFKELLRTLYAILKIIRVQGILEIEKHIEKPEESDIFRESPLLLSNKKALTFLCDYLRVITMGADNAVELESLMDEEIETYKDEGGQVPLLLQQIAEGLPAIGIVAAVLGVIHTMSAISQPPEVIGSMIGAALVGTFLGVLLSYGFFGPMANGIRAILSEEIKPFEVIKAGLLAHVRGQPPTIAIEFARKSIFQDQRPTFADIEATIESTRKAS